MADAAPRVALARIDAKQAVAHLAGFESTDPSGICDPADVEAVCRDGECFQLTGAIEAVYVVTVRNGVAWVQALRGRSDGGVDLLGVLDDVVMAQASEARSIGFQTRRPGLVRKAKERGFRVVGWVMKKDLR